MVKRCCDVGGADAVFYPNSDVRAGVVSALKGCACLLVFLLQLRGDYHYYINTLGEGEVVGDVIPGEGTGGLSSTAFVACTGVAVPRAAFL
jgi:hypothetical protein